MKYIQFIISIIFGAVCLLSALPAAAVTIYYIYADHLDTPRVITRSSDNQIVWSWTQGDPFGYVLPNQNPSGLGTFNYDVRFPGQIYDIETNTYDNVNRTYHPQLGRYIQSDPIGLNGRQWSTYDYVNGNPISHIDFNGLKTILITTFDYGIGSHSAVYIDTNGSKNLYDPGGSYMVLPSLGSTPYRPSGGLFQDSEADLESYLAYQRSTGSTVKTRTVPLSPTQEGKFLQNAEEIGDDGAGYCAADVSNAFKGIKGITSTFFPGSLYRMVK